jgi:SHS2 domain-containing protein
VFRFFDHTGDIGVDVEAPDLEGVFVESARALFEAIADTSHVLPSVERAVEAAGENRADLLNRFLAALLVTFDEERLLLPHLRVDELTPTRVRATARGERFDESRHEGRTELKAVTWHELSVEETDGRWRARVVFDV